MLTLEALDQRLLSEEDKISLNQLAPNEVQQWCSSRITEYQHHIRDLRELLYGAVAREAIFTTKSHIRALRSAYNDAAPINRHLLPELLIEVFSHVHPAVMPRPLARIPVLRVCRYWRKLLFRTPQFWANILSLPSWRSWNPKYHMGRFSAALARSVPQNLTLSLPYCDRTIASVLMPHTNRLSSLKVGPTLQCVNDIAQILDQLEYMPHLTHLAILRYSWYDSHLTFILNFSRYPNMQALELERTYIFTPVAPYASLSHLKLTQCAIRHPSTTASRVPALCTMLSALELFPNLNTLSMAHSLSDDDRHGLVPTLPELTKTVRLPRLRLLEITDIPAYIPHFLSQLVLPPTTSLSPATSPPHAELSLHLDFRSWDNGLVRWETHGAGVRPVRVTLAGGTRRVAVIAAFSRSLAAGLAPAGLSELTAVGGCAIWKYWDLLLPALPRLCRLTYEAGWTDTKGLLDVLGRRRRRRADDGFVCPCLKHLGLVWHVPPKIRVDAGEEDEEDEDAQWGPLGLRESGGDEDAVWTAECDLATSLRAFSSTLRARLVERGEGCERIRTLLVAPRQWRLQGSGIVLQEWQVALAEQRVRDRLGDLVEDIAVVKDFY
ncbi:hypothetical protein V8D89_002569 [Ganoderma adspersum]